VAQRSIILVYTERKRLTFLSEDGPHMYDVLTAHKGVGQEEGSYRTPLGLHRI
jgi:hypothetical protein